MYANRLVKTAPPRDLLTGIAVVAVCALATRDTFAATIRWALSISNLTLLWYAVDLLVAVGIVLFLRTAVRSHSALPWFAVAVIAIGLFTGSYFLSSAPLFLISATKMFLPLLLGWSFAGTDITVGRPWLVKYLTALCIIAVIGILISPYVEFPWASFKIETFGVERKGGETRWIQGQTRFAGFAGQNALAAMTVFMPLILIYKRLKPFSVAVLTALCLVSAIVTTSRTAIVATLLLAVWLAAARYLSPALRSVSSYRYVAIASLIFALTPIFLISFGSTVDLSRSYGALSSFQERIQLSWQYPFRYWYDARPEALLFGCGAGCFTSPMMYTDKILISRAVDNFYIETIIMFGIFSIFQIAIMISSPFKEVDRAKILAFALFNVIASLTDGYTIATLCFIAGYATSASFKADRCLASGGGHPKPGIADTYRRKVAAFEG